jgi:Holliday junction DNA helicase RuvA
MGAISDEELGRALDNEDVARLSSVPGLGKKTAQKMILALKGKLTRIDTAPGGRTRAAGPWHDLEDALADMGYDRGRAADALSEAAAGVDAALPQKKKEEEVFRRAVLLLAR